MAELLVSVVIAITTAVPSPGTSTSHTNLARNTNDLESQETVKWARRQAGTVATSATPAGRRHPTTAAMQYNVVFMVMDDDRPDQEYARYPHAEHGSPRSNGPRLPQGILSIPSVRAKSFIVYERTTARHHTGIQLPHEFPRRPWGKGVGESTAAFQGTWVHHVGEWEVVPHKLCPHWVVV